jgi:toxin ParE1/3/4
VAEIVWSGEAEEDLRAIREYIARDNPRVADRIVDDLVHSAERLREFPLSGRTVEELENEGVREIIVAPYPIAYQIAGEVVEILKVWHGKRMLRPEELRA